MTLVDTNSRLFFVLRNVINNIETEDQILTLQHTNQNGSQRKSNAKIKMLDDPKMEQFNMNRLIEPIPSFVMIDQEGNVYPETVNNRACQWDHYLIDWRPIGLPTKRYEIRKKPHFVCVRWFCSLECAKSLWERDLRHDGQFQNTLKYLKEMNRLTLEHLGYPDKPLESAGDPNLLKLTGSGTMDIETFRQPWNYKYQKEYAFVMVKGVEMYARFTN